MRRFFKEETGSNLVEYVLLIALVAIVCIPILQDLADTIGTFWDGISTRLAN